MRILSHISYRTLSLLCLLRYMVFLGIIAFIGFVVTSCNFASPNRINLNQGLATHHLSTQGWVIQRIDEPGAGNPLTYPNAMTPFLPYRSNAITLPETALGVQQQGIILQNLSPMWADRESTQLVTRLARGERVQILRFEPWAFDRIGYIRSYFVEDAFGNRGYVGNNALFFPTQVFEHLTLGIIESFRYSISLDPPYNHARAIGQPVELLTIHYPGATYVIIPEFYLPATGNLPSEGYLTFSLNPGQDPSVPELALIVTNPLPPTSTLVTFALITLHPDQPRVQYQYSKRTDGIITSIARPQFTVSTLPSTDIGERILPSTPGILFEYSGSFHDTLFAYSLLTEGNGFQPGPVRSHSLELSTNSQLRILEPNTALRRSPHQNSSLIQRLDLLTPVYPTGISVPSVSILSHRSYWIQVNVPELEGISGWVWGRYLGH